MALPKVTYGTYNYGEYARPTAIKYKGGLGEGIAQGLAKGVSSYMEAKEEKKQFGKKVETEVVKERARFGDALDIAAGSKFAEGENKKFIKQMKEDYGNAYRQWRLGNISAEEYEKTRSGLMSDLRNIASVKDQAMGALQLDIKEEDVRNTTDDLLRSERRDGFGNGLYLLGRDKDNNLTYTVETSGGTQTYAGMKILNDEKFFLPSLKYDNSVNASFNSAAPNLLKLLANTKPEYHTETVKGEYKYDTIDFDKHSAEIKASLMSSPNFTNILNDKTFDAKAYYEDNLGNLDKGNIYTGSPKQEEEIRQALADEVIQNAKINNISFNKRSLLASPRNVPKYILEAQDLATKRSEQGTNLNNLLNSFNSNPNQLGTGIFEELTSNPTAYGIPDFYKNYTTNKDLAKTEIEELKKSEVIREDQYKKFVEQIEKAPEGTLFSFDIDDLKKKRNPILDQKQTAINLLNQAAIFENLTTQEIDGIVRKWFDNNPIQKYLNPFVYGPKNK